MANYTPDYTSSDVAKAGANLFGVGLLELTAYAGIIVLTVIAVFLLSTWRKVKR